MQPRLIFILALLASLPALATEIYKTRDSQGNVVYTDRPPAGNSEQINLPPINTLSPAGQTATPQATRSDPVASEGYNINLLSPREGITIPPGQRDLAIAVGLSPALADNHWLLYFINDELIEETQSTSIIVREIPRGTHRIAVDAIDGDGKLLGQSEVVEVHVIRPTVNKPASGAGR